jgi:uncharacterized membrane protein HdeD (DUF308 family)
MDRTPMTNADFLSASLTSTVLSPIWWLVLLRGVLAAAFGLLTLSFPLQTVPSLVLVFAAYVAVDGALAFAVAFRAMHEHRQWAWQLMQAIANLMAAAGAVYWPGMTVVVFVLLTAAWSIISGFLILAAGLTMRENGWRWLVLAGTVSLSYGIPMILVPLLGALMLTWWLSAYTLVLGVALILLAFSLRKVAARHRR